MEIKIENKKNNPLLNRTEVHFTVTHDGEGTPNREIIRNELADKLNTKKENVVINDIRSGFGIRETKGYAKVYTSTKQAKGVERKHFLVRNKLTDKQDKKEGGEKKEKPQVPKEKTEVPPPSEPPKEEAAPEVEKVEEEKTEQEASSDEKPVDEKPKGDDKEPEDKKPDVASEEGKAEDKKE